MINTIWLVNAWYRAAPWLVPFYAISTLFSGVVRARRFCYLKGYFKSERLPVPVIVVGNITVGGTGKTPLVIWLVAQLRAKGLKPGVVSRGYGRITTGLQQVQIDSLPDEVGDEPLLIKWRAECPVIVAENRVLAGRELVAQGCNVIISDDGLQHYALARDLEILVIDGVRQLGNGRCLPAGPLREPRSRLKSVDFVVINQPIEFIELKVSVETCLEGSFPPCGGRTGWGVTSPIIDSRYTFTLQGSELINLKNPALRQPLCDWQGRTVHAVAGIGHPERFFVMLQKAGLHVLPHAFPDHHRYLASDLQAEWQEPVVMTEKDAVKFRPHARAQDWYLPVQAAMSSALQEDLLTAVARIYAGPDRERKRTLK